MTISAIPTRSAMYTAYYADANRDGALSKEELTGYKSTIDHYQQQIDMYKYYHGGDDKLLAGWDRFLSRQATNTEFLTTHFDTLKIAADVTGSPASTTLSAKALKTAAAKNGAPHILTAEEAQGKTAAASFLDGDAWFGNPNPWFSGYGPDSFGF